MNSGIDFVVLWVDGDDSEWIKSYNFHKKQLFANPTEIDTHRYRDMDILKYLFRSFDYYSPWVDNIYFVTCGQKPSWLTDVQGKLKFINHEDFIPKEFLPTFNSTTIEMFIHLIPNLSEKFVFFNDDTILNAPIPADFFYKKGKPCDTLALHPNIENNIESYPYGSIMHTAITILNSKFSPKNTLYNHFTKIFNYKYGLSTNLKNLLCIPWWGFSGFVNYHSAQPFTKTTFFKVWSAHSELLRKSAESKFRQGDNISQYLFRFSQLLEGDFHPVSQVNRSIFYNVSDSNIDSVLSCLKQAKIKVICINDSEKMTKFEYVTNELSTFLESKFPNKSSYEL
ncbi:Stealth CR1 domain-containing protein [Rosenbergiella epipactidis]|uniref:Stealth CR1 domain-containing protein n=1 Tax=Rosenbergiella epipactidis TaxID=1544694 RepID=UPI001F4D6952|nr:Stealth CR1 domain-containing protein [Rosenbergiella epipactidis]